MNKLFIVALFLPLQAFGYHFCRVGLMDGPAERRVTALCDGNLVLDKQAGSGNLGYGLFTRTMGDLLAQNPDLRVLNCEGTEFTTCFLVKK